MERYETKDGFVAAVENHLAHSAWPEAARRAAAQAIADSDESSETTAKATAFELRVGRWFLREDDTKFFEIVGAVGPVVATIATGAVLAPPAAVAATASVLGALWRMWRKSSQLTPAQLAVLTVLEAGGPTSEKQLADLLIERAVIHHAGELGALLDQLKDVELRDGSTIALVKRTETGLWRAVNI
jgi:hypothetical protein